MSKRKIVVTGGTGFIGKPLVERLRARGDEVLTLTRGPSGDGRAHWDPDGGELDLGALTGADAIVHLAGESLAGLWTGGKRRRILDSRRAGTELIAAAAAGLDPRPSALVCASAIGFYGSRGDELLTEQSGAGDGFLAEVVREWEDAAQPARDAGIRTVNLRVGLVLAAHGGVMNKLRPLFKLGAGGKLGDGGQWWSWVSLDDVLGAYLFALDDAALRGACNVAAPEPVTNAAFTKTLAAALHRPAVLSAPKFALRLAMREMADEMLLASQRVDSARLRDAGFAFADAALAPTLERLLR